MALDHLRPGRRAGGVSPLLAAEQGANGPRSPWVRLLDIVNRAVAATGFGLCFLNLFPTCVGVNRE